MVRVLAPCRIGQLGWTMLDPNLLIATHPGPDPKAYSNSDIARRWHMVVQQVRNLLGKIDGPAGSVFHVSSFVYLFMWEYPSNNQRTNVKMAHSVKHSSSGSYIHCPYNRPHIQSPNTTNTSLNQATKSISYIYIYIYRYIYIYL